MPFVDPENAPTMEKAPAVKNYITHGESTFIDKSTECAICLEPFNNSDADVDTSAVLQLHCGHRWHTTCLRQQLQHARPSPRQRLLFTGCRCAKCGVVCEHDALQDVLRPTDRLRNQVDTLIRAQWRVDHPTTATTTTATSNIEEWMMEEGRRKYAFYLCNSCNEPFFGGTVACAEEDDAAVVDRTCPDCSPSQVQCTSPQLHRGAYIWKCRYCCRPAVFVCYGSVHFCAACHDCNSQRVQQQQQQRGSSHKPPPLTAIPCPGVSCATHPKRPGEQMHRNGPTSDCEQVYACAACDGRATARTMVPPGSHNFLVNTSGEDGRTVGWTHISPRTNWQVERWEEDPSTTNFVSSYRWCTMVQRVTVPASSDDYVVRVEVAADCMGRTDCPSVYRIEGRLVGVDQRHNDLRAVLRNSPVAGCVQGRTSADAWERVSFVVDVPRTPTGNCMVDLWVIVSGKDERFWQGLFGAKIRNLSARVLGTPAEIARLSLAPPHAGTCLPRSSSRLTHFSPTR